MKLNSGQRGTNRGTQRDVVLTPGWRFEFPLQAQVTSDRSQVDRFLRLHALQLKDNTRLFNQASNHQEWRSRAEQSFPPPQSDLSSSRGPDINAADRERGLSSLQQHLGCNYPVWHKLIFRKGRTRVPAVCGPPPSLRLRYLLR